MSSSLSQHRIVCYGEVLWDILPTSALPGGAPMNVAYHLKKLGEDPVLITRIGLDDYGKQLVNVFSDKGVNTDYFQVDYDHDTGLVYAKPNEHNEVVYDIVNPVAWDFIQWEDEFVDLVKQANYFVFGSLTSRNPTSRETLYKLLEIANTKVLDINLRAPNYRRSYVEFLLEKADILKVNFAELELITGWFSHFTSMEERMKTLQDQFKIDLLIVTMGGEGALVSDKGKIHRHPGYKVQVADTIGSGDAFLAGFLHELLIGHSTQQALEFASGVGAFIATRPGACPDYQIKEIEELITTAKNKVAS